MANPEHVKLVLEGVKDEAGWRVEAAKGETLDLRDADFTGRNLSGLLLTRADCTGAKFDGATLSNVTFTQCELASASLRGISVPQLNRAPRRLTFNHCKLDQTDFSNANISEAWFSNSDIAQSNFDGVNIERAGLYTSNFRNTCLANCNLTHAEIRSSHFNRCNLTLTNLTRSHLKDMHLCDSDIQGANFNEAEIEGGTWQDNLNLEKAAHLEKALVDKEPLYVRDTPLPWRESLCDWEKLRTFGRMPLFGLSYSVLILIPSYCYLLAWYNSQIAQLREWEGPGKEWVWNHLHPLPMPSLSLLLLGSTLLLAIASTLYTLFCPSRIKEFTKDVWCDQLRHSILSYWPLAWRHRTIRLVCGACYIVGGTGAIYVLIIKVSKAGLFIINHAGF